MFVKKQCLFTSLSNVILKPFPKQALDFTRLQNKSFENTAGKGEIAHNEQFLLSPFLTVFSTSFRNFQSFFIKFEIAVYKLFQIGTV